MTGRARPSRTADRAASLIARGIFMMTSGTRTNNTWCANVAGNDVYELGERLGANTEIDVVDNTEGGTESRKAPTTTL